MGAGSGDRHGDVRERDSADFFHSVSEFFDSMEGFQGLSEGGNVSIGGDGVVVVLSDEYVRAFNRTNAAFRGRGLVSHGFSKYLRQ